MVSFKSLLGVVARRARTVSKVVVAGVSDKKEYRSTLCTFEKLKPAKEAREGDDNKFIFFESDG